MDVPGLLGLDVNAAVPLKVLFGAWVATQISTVGFALSSWVAAGHVPFTSNDQFALVWSTFLFLFPAIATTVLMVKPNTRRDHVIGAWITVNVLLSQFALIEVTTSGHAQPIRLTSRNRAQAVSTGGIAKGDYPGVGAITSVCVFASLLTVATLMQALSVYASIKHLTSKAPSQQEANGAVTAA